MKTLAALVVMTVAVGCAPIEEAAQAQVDKKTQQLAEGLQKEWDARWGPEVEKKFGEAKKAVDSTSQLAKEEARRQLVTLQGQLADAKVPAEQIDAVKARIAQLDASMQVDRLQQEVDKRVREAQALSQNAQKTMDQVKSELQRLDQTFQDLMLKLENARAVLESANTKVETMTF